MYLVKVVVFVVIVFYVMVVGIFIVSCDNGIICIFGEFMCIVYVKDWVGLDEIWICNV